MAKRRKAPAGTYWRDGVLWGRVRLAGKPAFQRSLDTDDPKIAARRIAAIKAELTGRVRHGEARYSFSEATAAWGAHLTDRVSVKTADRYLCSLKVLEPYLRDKFIDQINGPLIAEIIKGRRDDGKTVSTIKRDLGALSSVMGFCVDEGWLEANPVLARLGRLKVKHVPIELPDPAHIEIIIRRAPGRLADLIRAAKATGCRMDELVSAKRTQFSDNARQLTVIGKRNKMRTIDLNDEAFAILRDCASDNAEYLFSHDGKKYKQVSCRWRNLCDGSAGHAGPNNDGITPFPFHNLRHLYAVDYLKTPLPDGRTPSIYVLSKHLGHTSVKTTEIYLAYLSGPEQQAVMFGKAA
jgi:integrase/recombinase XerD